MSRHRTFYPSDSSMRSNTPATRDNERIQHVRYVASEGHYDTTCNLDDKSISVTFSFLHDYKFEEPINIYRKEWLTEENVLSQFNTWRYNPYDAVHKLDANNTYCMPVILRDHKIKLLGHDPNSKIMRQRKGHKYSVSMIFANMPCKDWHKAHYHGTKIIIEDYATRKLFHEETFDCDHVWEGIERYKYILNNFDMVYMECHL